MAADTKQKNNSKIFLLLKDIYCTIDRTIDHKGKSVRIDENSPIPKYFQLQIWLKEQIDQGVFANNEKIPTEDDFVKQFQLSRATVRHAVQNLVDKGYLLRKKKLGTFVHTTSQQTGNRYRLGILINFYHSGFGIEFIRGAADQAVVHNCHLVLCNSYDLYVQAHDQADRLIEQAVTGVLFMPTAAADEKNRALVNKFLRHGIPVVIADRVIPGLDIDNVITDNYDGAYRITRHLIDQGHTRIAIVINTLLNSARERLSGYKAAMQDSHLPVRSELIFTSDEHYSEENCSEIARMLLSQKRNYTAVFAENDKMAHIICATAENNGFHIPRDLSIVGYDDAPFVDNSPIRLTTMHQPIYEMGATSINLLLQRIAGDTSKIHTVLLHSHLVVRESVLPLR